MLVAKARMTPDTWPTHAASAPTPKIATQKRSGDIEAAENFEAEVRGLQPSNPSPGKF
jgi:hypothetical protein